MPAPEGSQLNQALNPMLTNIAIGLLPKVEAPSDQGGLGFVARMIFPTVPVASPSGQYNIWKRGDFLRRGGKALANFESPPIEGYSTGKGSYTTDSWGVSTAYTARDLAEARRAGTSEMTMRANKNLFIVTKGLLELEYKVATLVQTNANWTTVRTGVANAPSGVQFIQWDQPGATPIDDVLAYKELMRLTCGWAPNKMVIPIIVWLALMKNPQLIGRITYSGTMDRPTQVNLQQLKDLFQIQNIVIAEGVANTAAEGSADAYSYIWGKKVWMGYVTDAPSLDTPTAGYNFAWTGDATAGLPAGVSGLGNQGPAQFGAVMSPEGIFIRSYDLLRPSARFIDGEMYTQPNVTAADLGVILDAVIA